MVGRLERMGFILVWMRHSLREDEMNPSDSSPECQCEHRNSPGLNPTSSNLQKNHIAIGWNSDEYKDRKIANLAVHTWEEQEFFMVRRCSVDGASASCKAGPSSIQRSAPQGGFSHWAYKRCGDRERPWRMAKVFYEGDWLNFIMLSNMKNKRYVFYQIWKIECMYAIKYEK